VFQPVAGPRSRYDQPAGIGGETGTNDGAPTSNGYAHGQKAVPGRNLLDRFAKMLMGTAGGLPISVIPARSRTPLPLAGRHVVRGPAKGFFSEAMPGQKQVLAACRQRGLQGVRNSRWLHVNVSDARVFQQGR
jgi:hypothetical protein